MRTINKRLTAVERRRSRGRRVFVHWPNGDYTEGLTTTTLPEIDALRASGWDVVVIRVMYANDWRDLAAT